ncbi:glycosyl transferase [Gemmatimonadetes bacterium T265]|nr:glycosyl transferase [Gemmatimonadetes bacterium T265]
MTPATVVDGALAVTAAPALAAAGYLAALAATARPVAPPPAADSVRFDVVVPAHDEAGGIGATVASLLALDYPRAKFRVLVVADNCTDDTAARARAAGALVLKRHDAARRGKGYALAHAYAACLADGVADAVVVVDADTVVSPNLLRAFAARFAAGEAAVQAEYGVRNATATWRTRLMAVAFACYHTTRSLGRERLRLSCGLRGNGMGFSADTLRRHPHRAFSRVEDVEYGVALGAAGVRVAYVPEATVLGDMPTTAEAAQTQRERWETGRAGLVRRLVPTLVRATIARRDRVPLDLAADLLVPPLTTLVAVAVLGTAIATASAWRGWAGPLGVAPWGAVLVCLAAYVARGAALAGHGPRVLLDLAWGPAYAAWKLAVALHPRTRGDTWVRTARAPVVAAPDGPAIERVAGAPHTSGAS